MRLVAWLAAPHQKRLQIPSFAGKSAMRSINNFVHSLHKVIYTVTPIQHIPSLDGAEKIQSMQMQIFIGVDYRIMDQTIDEIKAIISSDSDMAEKINSMPYNLHLEDLMDFLGFCESTTRKITQQPGFPYIKTGITKLTVPRPLFLEWYFSNCFYRN